MRNIIFSLLLIFCGCACSNKEVYRFEGQVFGTFYSVSYVGSMSPSLKRSADSLLAEISSVFSVFDTNSLVSRFNSGESVVLNEDFRRVFEISKEVYEETGGAFDCTVQPLVQLWGFGKGGMRKVVSDDTLNEIQKHVGFHLVDVKDNEAVKLDSLVQLNFNAVAKGYAVEKLAELMEYKGYGNCLVEIGGEVAARGCKNGKPWKVGIQVPCDEANSAVESFTSFPLAHHRAVATSGNYRNYFEENGIRYTHIIDPRSGKPERTNLLSITVMASDCAAADAFATAFMVLGFDESSKIVKNNPDIEAWFVIGGDASDWNVVKIE